MHPEDAARFVAVYEAAPDDARSSLDLAGAHEAVERWRAIAVLQTVDHHGLPLHVLVSAANTHDSKLFEPLLETNPPVGGRRHHPGRPRRRPERLHADKGYDYPRCRRYLHRRGTKVRIARRGVEDKSKLGRHRCVVERSVSWLLRFKRLGLRYGRTEATLRPLQLLAVSIINLRRLASLGRR